MSAHIHGWDFSRRAKGWGAQCDCGLAVEGTSVDQSTWTWTLSGAPAPVVVQRAATCDLEEALHSSAEHFGDVSGDEAPEVLVDIGERLGELYASPEWINKQRELDYTQMEEDARLTLDLVAGRIMALCDHCDAHLTVEPAVFAAGGCPRCSKGLLGLVGDGRGGRARKE